VCGKLSHRTLWLKVYRLLREFSHNTMWHSQAESYKVCRELSHRKMWDRLAESLKGVLKVITPHNLAQSFREFIGCVERYYTTICGSVWRRIDMVCGESTHRALWHRLVQSL